MDWFCYLLIVYRCIFVIAYAYNRNDDVNSELTGTNLKLSCNIHGHDSMYWEWWPYADKTFQPLRAKTDRSNRFTGIWGPQLIIKNLDTQASGGYRCRYYNSGDGSTEANRKMSNDFWLYVTERTSHLTLHCLTERAHPHHYGWQTYTYGQFTHTLHQTQNYTIDLKSIHQTALFRCRFYPPIGWFYNQIRVIVTEKPNIRARNRTHIAISGTSVTLQCQLDETFPLVTDCGWRKHGTIRDTEITKQMPINNVISLTLSSVTEKDSGSYYCYACNGVGCSSVQIDLKAGDKPVISTEKTFISEECLNVSLKMSVSSSANYPVTDDSWRYSKWETFAKEDLDERRGRFVKSSLGHVYLLSIRQATISDDGYYTFSIRNTIGWSNMTTHLIVWKRPTVETEKKEYYLAVGSTIHILCTVNTIDYNIKNITWFKKASREKEVVVTGTKASHSTYDNIYLNLLTVNKDDGGEYVCTGAHDYGKGNKTIFVHTGEPPSVRVQQEYVSKDRDNVVILCHVYSNSSFTSTLYQRGGISSFLPSPKFHEGTLEKTQKFRLPSLTKQYAGMYICQANNTYGTGRNETELIILYANVTGQRHGLKRNMTLKLVCDTNRKGSVRWKLNGETITDQITRILYIQKINRIHTGNYTCENTYGGITATSVSVYINVKDLPMVYSNQLNNTALVGDDIVVHCGYDKESKPSYVEWSHNNVPISNFYSKRYSGGTVSVPTLTIHKAEKSDSGNYTCNVTNEIGYSYSGVISIIVTEERGSGLTITCNSKNKWNVYWELKRPKDTRFIPLNHIPKEAKIDRFIESRTYFKSSLQIRRLRKEIFGKYRCRFYSDPYLPIKQRGKSKGLYIGIQVQISKKPLGNYVRLKCEVESFPTAISVVWTKNGKKMTSKVYGQVHYVDIKVGSETYTGNYTCTASNKYFRESKSFLFGDKPDILPGVRQFAVKQGVTVTFNVTIKSANPPVTLVSWYCGQRVIKNSSTFMQLESPPVYLLRITNLETEHVGNYTCIVRNSVGASFEDFLLWKRPEVKVEPPIIYTKTSSSITAKCKVSSQLWINHISWNAKTTNGVTEISENKAIIQYSQHAQFKTEDTYTITSLTENSTYICKARHKYGEGESQVSVFVGDTPRVRIKYDEYVYKVGDKVSMQCEVASATASNTSWAFSTNNSINSPISQWKEIYGAIFLIDKIDASHAGTYTCIGNNIYGSQKGHTKLVVLSSKLTGNSTGIEKGMNVRLICTASGKGKIIWAKDNSPIPNTSETHLILNEVSRDDSGCYTCEISYRNVTAKSEPLRIFVKDIPLVSSDASIIESFTDKTVTLHCEFDQESSPEQVNWLFNNVSIYASDLIRYSGGNRTVPSLTIHTPQPSDSGDYVCAVGNSVGTAYSKVLKLIIKAPAIQKASGNVAVITGSVGSSVGLLIAFTVIFVLVKKRKDKGNNNIPSRNSTVDANNTDNLYSRVEKQNSSINMEIRSERPSTSNIAGRVIDEKVVESNVDSTYYNAFETKPTRIKVTEVKDYLKKKGDDGIREEFKEIDKCKKSKVPYGILHPTTYAEKPANKTKNRYKTTFAYDHTRVTLQNGSFKTDYINANYIDGFDKERQYIACQGPTQATLIDHWRMIWQENVHQVIMLTNLVEGMKAKCERYWPEGSEQLKIGPFKLTLVTEKERATFVTREIDVYDKETTKNRRVVQYHFTAWPDHGTPNPLDLVAFYRRVVADEKKENIPILVHCSAGIGRTGTYIGLDAMTKSGNTTGYIDIFDFLKQMRYCRMNMVQTAEQYVFLYHALIEMFKLKDTAVRRDQLEHVWRNIESEKGPINTHGLYKEFKILKACVEETVGKPAVLSPVDANKNRNRRIVPLDNSRVFLVSYERGRSDYINAVNVPSYTHQRGFLVTQLPLQDTRVDFWTMMVDHGSKTIVLILDNEKEVNIFYSSDMSRLEIGSFTIDVVNKEDCGNGIAKVTVDVTRKNYEETYRFLLYQIVSEDTLSPSQLGGITDLVFRQETNSDRTITVVSGDGARNCGLFCVFTNAVSSMTMDDGVDIFHLSRVAKLHQPAFLSEYDEYRRCYEALYVYTESTTMYANT